MINETMWGIGTALYNAAFGRIGITEFASIQAGTTIMNLFSLACFSMGDALLILEGEKLGSGAIDEAKYIAAKIMQVVLIIGFAAGGLLFVTSRLIVGLFRFSELGTYYTLMILTVFSVVMVIKVTNSALLTGVLRAGGDTRFPMLAEVLCVWLIGVPAAFYFSLNAHLPVYLVVLIVQAEEIVKLFLLTHRYRAKNWARDLVMDI
jgi:Na+-driven multidrug efflux pump